MFYADLHIHSTFSDGKHTVSEIVDFFGIRGFGCISITDHVCSEYSFLGKAAQILNKCVDRKKFKDYMMELQEEGARALEQYGMVVIPGLEISMNFFSNKRSAHLLAIGVTDFISADGTIEDILGQIKSQGALSIAAHPVWTQKLEKQTFHLWTRREQLRGEIDAWEVASGPVLFKEVLHSGLPIVANSDMHRFDQVSSWKNKMDCAREQNAILTAVREQKLQFAFYQDQEKISQFRDTL